MESGWTGVVVRHVAASLDDRPHKVVPVVKWDRNGVETKVRPNRVRVYETAESKLPPLSAHDQRRAIRCLKNLVYGEVCSYGMEMDHRRFSTCRDYMTHRTGGPHPGCDHCQAVAFLKLIDPSFDPYK